MTSPRNGAVLQVCLFSKVWIGLILSFSGRKSFFLFGHKNIKFYLEIFLQKHILNMTSNSKNIQKNIKVVQQEHAKKVKYYKVDFQINTHSFLPPSYFFFKGGKRNFLEIGHREQFIKKPVRETKRGGVTQSLQENEIF